jgi:Tfp pilus assembly protein PilV
VTAAAVIDLRWGRVSGLAARLRGEDGIGLIELLIALLVLNVGIFATFGAFTSAAANLKRASRVSTASAIADQEIEALHNLKFGNIVSVGVPTPAAWPSAQTPDGGSYTYQVVVSQGAGVTVTGGSANLKQATVTVTSSADPRAKVTSITTFSQCTQSGLQADSTPNPCQS